MFTWPKWIHSGRLVFTCHWPKLVMLLIYCLNKKHLLDHKNDHNSLIGFVSFFIQIQFDSKNSISCCCQSSCPAYNLTIFLGQGTSHGSQELVHRHVDLRSEIVGKHGGQDHEEVVSKNLWKDEDHILKKTPCC